MSGRVNCCARCLTMSCGPRGHRASAAILASHGQMVELGSVGDSFSATLLGDASLTEEP